MKLILAPNSGNYPKHCSSSGTKVDLGRKPLSYRKQHIAAAYYLRETSRAHLHPHALVQYTQTRPTVRKSFTRSAMEIPQWSLTAESSLITPPWTKRSAILTNYSLSKVKRKPSISHKHWTSGAIKLKLTVLFVQHS